jgi:hypothetical protein
MPLALLQKITCYPKAPSTSSFKTQAAINTKTRELEHNERLDAREEGRLVQEMVKIAGDMGPGASDASEQSGQLEEPQPEPEEATPPFSNTEANGGQRNCDGSGSIGVDVIGSKGPKPYQGCMVTAYDRTR